MGRVRRNTARLSGSVQQRNHVGNAPNRIGHARFHGWCDAEGLMNAAEVVVHVVKGNRRFVVFQLFGKSVCQPGEAAHSHPHREVLTFHEGGGDVLEVRTTHDLDFLCSGALSRAVTLFGSAAVLETVELHQDRVIDFRVKGILDGGRVGAVPVRGELDAVREASGEIVHELRGATSVATANEPARNKLGVGINRNPCPSVAPSIRLLVCGGVLGLGSNKAPDFIALDALAREVHKNLGLVGGTSGTQIHKELLDRGTVCAGHPHDGTEAVSFHEGGNDADAFCCAQLVHTDETTAYA